MSDATMKAIEVHEFGGPEVLEVVDVSVPTPGDGQLLIRVNLAGVNFADTGARENAYLAEQTLPLRLGLEVAGIVERAADGFEQGQRVLALMPNGGYAAYTLGFSIVTFPLPDEVSDHQALALLVPGCTAWHICRTFGRISDGESVLVTAGAGGVGTLAIQLARREGAGRVVATASSEEKRSLCLDLGADAAVDPMGDLAAGLREANDGEPFDVVLEMTGGEVFRTCLEALAPFGRLVAYGAASGEPSQLDVRELMRGSKTVSGFWLSDAAGRGNTGAVLANLFELVAGGKLVVPEGRVYPLTEAAQAHADLQARRTTGKLALDPGPHGKT
jgi:NADPH:quinone reductase